MKRSRQAGLRPPFLPMEARSVAEIPTGPDWQYEPKWDGFRCIAFRNSDKIELQSKSGRPLTRYFPEIATALGALKAPRFVLDGELMVPHGRYFSFDDLLQRVHPAASRIGKLSQQTPALMMLFDLLQVEDRILTGLPLAERRGALEVFHRRFARKNRYLRLSPASTKLADARRWFGAVGHALDGIMAKRLDLPYQSGSRDGMQKIKNHRSADCVIGGFRLGAGKLVGSLLLGLYNDKGLLDHVGFTSALKAGEKPELTRKLKQLVAEPGFTGDKPGGPSRWSTKSSAQWQPVKPKLVVEVSYDHFSGGRFRHGTKLLRWRPDKAARQCTIEQVKQRAGSLFELLS